MIAPGLMGLDVSWDSPLAGVEPEYSTLDHPVWAEIAADPDAGTGGFAVLEFEQPALMDVHFLRWLYQVRQIAGVPMRLTEDARGLDETIGSKTSAHKKRPCRAVDLVVSNRYERARIVAAAILLGCRRWGVYPEKEGTGGAGVVHLDLSAHPDNPSPRHWTDW